MQLRLPLFLCVLFFCIGLNGQSHVPIFHGDLKCHLGTNGALKGGGFDWLQLERNSTWSELVHHGGLWIGGFDTNGGNLRIADLTEGGIPGPTGADWGYEQVWSVTAAEVEAHLADLADNGEIDNPIAPIFAWPGRGNPHFSDYNYGILPLSAGEMAPFFDQDGDGIYDPEAGDYPVLTIEGCQTEIVPSQMHWCVFRVDWDNATDVNPLEVHLCLFSFGCEEEDHPLNQSFFLQYSLFQKEEQSGAGMKDFIIGWHFLPPGGFVNGNYVGSFPQRNAAFVYSSGNDNWLFGENPPAYAFDWLSWPSALDGHPQPFKGVRHYFSGAVGNPPPLATNPQTFQQYYDYLQGLWNNGEPMTVGGLGIGGTEPTNFCFPGLPEQPGGWTEWEAQNDPHLQRYLLSYLSPFDLQPGSRNELLLSFTVSNTESGHLAEVTHLRDQLDAVQAYFDNCFQLQTTPGFPGCSLLPSEVSSPKAGNPYWTLSPNPAQTYVQVEIPGVPGGTITLLDVTGQVMRHIPVKEAVETIDTSDLPGGLYLIRWVDKQQRVSVKRLVIH